MNEDLFDIQLLEDAQREFYLQFLTYGKCAPAIVKSEYQRALADGRVQTFYFARRRFNACAWSHGNEYFVALNASVPSLLHFCFNYVIRNPHIFPNVSTPNEETHEQDKFDRGIPLSLPETASIEEGVKLLPRVSRPENDERALIATALTELATCFCVFHEVGHIVGGHAAYLEHRMSNARLVEFTSERLGFCPKRLIRRVWEREADIIAIVMLMSFVSTDSSTRSHYAAILGIDNDEGELYHLAGIILFVVKVLFLYLAQVGNRFDSKNFHPHPLIRATYVHNALRLTAIHQLGLEEERINHSLDLMTDVADAVCDELGLMAPALHGKQTPGELAQTVENEVIALERAHIRLQQRFYKYSWMPKDIWREQG